jgi:hypothetical protein
MVHLINGLSTDSLDDLEFDIPRSDGRPLHRVIIQLRAAGNAAHPDCNGAQPGDSRVQRANESPPPEDKNPPRPNQIVSRATPPSIAPVRMLTRARRTMTLVAAILTHVTAVIVPGIRTMKMSLCKPTQTAG